MFILVNGNWPSFSSSKLDIVGLFSDAESTLASSEYAVHCQAMFKSAIILGQKPPNFTIGWRTAQTGGDFIRTLGIPDISYAATNPELSDRNGLIIVESIVFYLVTTSIRGDLTEILLGSPSRIVILWAFDAYTPLILREAIEKDVVGPRFTGILRSKISLESFNRTSYEK